MIRFSLIVKFLRRTGNLILTVLTAIIIGSGYPASSSGYELDGHKWPEYHMTFRFNMPATHVSWNSQFKQAILRWNNTSTFTINSEDEFSDPCSNPNVALPVNGAAFAADICGVAFGANTLAIARTWTTDDGKLAKQSSIIFNSSKSWGNYNGPLTVPYDFTRVAVHELGHSIGLAHENEIPSIMKFDIGDIIIPTADDMQGIRFLYPDVSYPIIRKNNIVVVEFELTGIPQSTSGPVDIMNIKVNNEDLPTLPTIANNLLVRLYDVNNNLIGTYQTTNGSEAVFKNSTSPYTNRTPTVIDFTSIRNGTFKGRFEYQFTSYISDYQSLSLRLKNAIITIGTATSPTGFVHQTLTNLVNITNAYIGTDTNNDGLLDIRDNDSDTDGIFDSVDNCIYLSNTSQTDSDQNGTGDACEIDVSPTDITDLRVTKVVNTKSPTVGNPVEFKVGVTNEGSNGASNIVVSDLLPQGMLIPSGMAPFFSQGTYTPATGIWQVGLLGSGRVATLTVPAIPQQFITPECFVNEANITSFSGTDSSASNDRAIATVFVGGITDCAHLKITVTPEIVSQQQCNGLFSSNNRLVFNFRITNAGPGAAQNVNLTLTGNYKNLVEPYVGTRNLPLNRILAGGQVSGTMSWTLPCGLSAGVASYSMVLASDSKISTGSVMSVSADFNIPDTGICNCSQSLPVSTSDTGTDGSGGGGGGGCFIATAAYGSYMHPYVTILRTFRDDVLDETYFGREFIAFYYQYSPEVADLISQHPPLAALVRLLLIPLVFTVVHPVAGALLILISVLILLKYRHGHRA